MPKGEVVVTVSGDEGTLKQYSTTNLATALTVLSVLDNVFGKSSTKKRRGKRGRPKGSKNKGTKPKIQKPSESA